MRAFKLTLASLSLLLFAAACNSSTTHNQAASNANRAAAPANSATPAPAATPDELAQAAADYKNACIKCHKADGSGGSFDNEGKEVKVPDLRTHTKKDTDKELYEQIAEGGDNMPPFKKKFENDPERRINGLVRYIRREFNGQTTGAPAGDSNAAATPAK